MTAELKVDVFEKLLENVTENNKNVIQLNGQIEEKILHIKSSKTLNQSYKKKKSRFRENLFAMKSENFAIPEKELELSKQNK